MPNGRATLSAESLLTHHRWVRELALSLVHHDEGRAHDVVQQTWLAVLRDPPRRVQSVRAWLRTVVRNFVRSSYREDARRRSREERAGQPESIPSEQDTLQRVELQGAIVAAVLDLDPAYRQVILHRYFHERSPSEIAVDLALPLETVKTRLRRGKERLRRVLGAHDNDASHLWSLALFPGAARPLGEATASGGMVGTAAASVSSATTALSMGGILMSTKLTAVSLAAAVILGGFGLVAHIDRNEQRDLALSNAQQRDGALGRLEESEAELERLRGEIEAATSREATLASQMEAIRRRSEAKKLAPETEETSAVTAAVSSALTPTTREAFGLDSPDEADALLADLMAKGDIEGIWLLGAELLALGDEGFDKLYELAALLSDDKAMMQNMQLLWRQEEVLAGGFLRALGENVEGVLRLGLYLDEKPPEELTGILKEFHREMADEMGVVLLGYYAGGDPELLGAYVERYRGLLGADPGSIRKSDDMIRALGQIKTEESTELLAELLGRTEGRNRESVIQSLAWQRNPRAVEILETLLQNTSDERQVQIIEAALRYLR